MKISSRNHVTFFFLLLLVLSATVTSKVSAWSNGGYSSDPSNPDYGTHDWIAQHVLDWLPDAEKQYITDNLATYLYGTELPDNAGAEDGIGDTFNHHNYYSSGGVMTDDAAAVRASEVYGETLTFLVAGDLANAAKHAGIMIHYIADVAVFGHVMGSGTDWGAEEHHSDYETYVNQRTSSYDVDFNSYLSFDGSLTNISAYDAAKDLAYDTTFDVDGDLTCVWMDQNYDWSNPTFRDRCGESLNLAVNYIADVLHTLYVEATTETNSDETTSDYVVINEFELNPPGNDNYNSVVEWVELYNPTSSSISIGGWKLSTTHGERVTITISSGTTIAANGYYVVGRGSQWLDNEDESIILRDSAGNEVDRTPVKSDTYNDGRSWQRYPNGKDTDTAADWSLHASTKEESNGEEEEPICIIATTIYGSELAPEVQFLRDFRESVVLSTFAGGNFMRVFNAWYYSFSPSVAHLIAGQPVVKTVMRVVLYPMIGILHLSSITYSAFSSSPEFGVMMAGLVASSLIGIVYFTLPAVTLLEIIKRYKKKTVKIGRLKLLVVPWLISVVLLFLGEITFSSVVMMAATASFVLTTLVSSAILTASKITQRFP